MNCKNKRSQKFFFKHLFYYILNIFCLKNSLTKQEQYEILDKDIIDFNSDYNGMWQSIPKEVYASILHKKVNLVIKFGMNLLKVDQKLNSVPFLSFHHGNPSKYRGRPAGFYEILNGEKTVGIIVQELTNKLDAGKVLAFAESKIVKFSYKKLQKISI